MRRPAGDTPGSTQFFRGITLTVTGQRALKRLTVAKCACEPGAGGKATPQAKAAEHRGDGKRFVAHAEEKLTAFVELESATRLLECASHWFLVRPSWFSRT